MMKKLQAEINPQLVLLQAVRHGVLNAEPAGSRTDTVGVSAGIPFFHMLL